MSMITKSTIFLVLALVAACSSKAKAQDNIAKPVAPESMPVQETVTGKVAVNDHGGGNMQVLIEVHKDSKSVVSYEVSGAQKDAVAAQNGKKITVTGMVRNLSPFHKLIDVSQLQ
jgi:hypothetical protein